MIFSIGILGHYPWVCIGSFITVWVPIPLGRDGYPMDADEREERGKAIAEVHGVKRLDSTRTESLPSPATEHTMYTLTTSRTGSAHAQITSTEM